jgi:hypothetical protein
MEKYNVSITNGYGSGAPKIEATIDGVRYIIDKYELEDALLKAITEKGFTFTKEKSQKIPRLHINL